MNNLSSMTDRQRDRARQAAARGRRLRKDPMALVESACLDIPTGQKKRLAARIAEIPLTARLTYITATKGNSRAAAIKAHCQMCMGYEQMREAIHDCTDPACPLYPYRPYTGEQIDEED